jgi:hypothetical protein
MSIVLTGTKTLSNAPAPHLTAAALTTILAKAPEQMTVADLQTLLDALSRSPNINPSATIGSLLS